MSNPAVRPRKSKPKVIYAEASKPEGRPEAAPPAAGNPQGGKYSVQVHSFRTNSLATEARRPLEAAGFTCFIKFFPGNAGWYAVFVGPFEDLNTAREKSAEFRTRGLAPVIRQQ